MVMSHDTFHSCCDLSENRKHSSFLLAAPIDNIRQDHMPTEVIDAFFDETKSVVFKSDYSKMGLYIRLFLCDI